MASADARLSDYQGLKYIASKTPPFAHQFSHALIDFRHKHDASANYFANSAIAARAHMLFCLSLSDQFPDYRENLWGISSSDSPGVMWHGRTSGNGPNRRHHRSFVPSAAGGSIPFLPEHTLAVLENIYDRFPAAWTRYGDVNAFNP
jgi:hypothetical protein